jgi:hypothetical protein
MPKRCPYAKSDMTPCVIKDGPICFAFGANDEPICVGCERSPDALGVPRPADWDRTVAEFRHKQAPPRNRRRK